MVDGVALVIGGSRGIPRIIRLTAISGLAKAPGFLIPLVIAAFFGAGHLTDAYFLAYGGVLLVGGMVAQPLEAVIVPFAAHALALGRQAADQFMRSLFRRGMFVGFGSTALGAALIGGALWIAPPAGVSRSMVFGFFLLLAPAAVAWCIAGIYSGSLVSGWHLEVGAAAYGFRGVGALVGAIVGAVVHHLWPVAVGVSVGEWARVWWLRRHWRRAITRMPEGTTGAPEQGLLRAAVSQMIAQGAVSGAQFFERFLVATVAMAAVSRIEYANRLIMAAAVLFDGGIGPWLLARWSNAQVRTALHSDWLTVYRPIIFSAVAACGVAGVLVLGAPAIVAGILHHGAFSAADTAVVTQLLRWYAAGYVFNMSALCVERLLLARTQNRLFAALSIMRAGVRLGAVVVTLPRMGVLALPIGYLVAEALYFCTLMAVSRRESVVRLSAMHA